MCVNSKQLNSFDRQKLEELYWRKGLSIAQIAERFGMSKKKVYNCMIKHGIKRRKHKSLKIGPGKLEELYWKQGFSYPQIAKILGMSPSWVRLQMIKHGVKRKQLMLNPNLTPSEHLAYLMGALKGDGSIRHKGVSLKVKDEEFVNEVEACLRKINLNPKKRMREDGQYEVWAYSVKLTKWIEENLMNLPQILGEREIRAFVRGFFDAEGSAMPRRFSFSRSGWNRIEFTNTDLKLMKLVRDMLNKLGILTSLRFKQVLKSGKSEYLLSVLRPSKLMFIRLIGSTISRKAERLQMIEEDLVQRELAREVKT